MRTARCSAPCLFLWPQVDQKIRCVPFSCCYKASDGNRTHGETDKKQKFMARWNAWMDPDPNCSQENSRDDRNQTTRNIPQINSPESFVLQASVVIVSGHQPLQVRIKTSKYTTWNEHGRRRTNVLKITEGFSGPMFSDNHVLAFGLLLHTSPPPSHLKLA
jgi:hypothetical protein